jgi:hypothetical protein
MLAGVREMTGSGSVRFSVTEVVCGVFVAPAAAIVIVAVCVPAERPAVFTLTVTLSVSPVELPLAGVRLSQA